MKQFLTGILSIFFVLLTTASAAEKKCFEFDGQINKSINKWSFSVKLLCSTNIQVEKNGVPSTEYQLRSNYLFIELPVSKSISKTSFLIRDPIGQDFIFIPLWQNQESFSWHDAVLYQVMTDRFHNGNITNDAPLADVPIISNWQGGDFAGIIMKLDSGFFTSLGINTLWISSPIANTNRSGKGRDDNHVHAAYHSYWPIGTGHSAYQEFPDLPSPIEPRFGTEAELQELVEKAHRQGIRVMVDFVANHVHEDAPLFKLHQNDGGFFPYFLCGWDEAPISCWFTEYLPDFNFDNQEILKKMVDHAMWLITKFNFDAMRLDALKHMSPKIVTAIKKSIREKIETTGIKFYVIGETVGGDMELDVIGGYLGADKVDGQFDFPLFYHLSRTFFIGNETLKTFYNFLKNHQGIYQRKYYAEALMGNLIGNHDTVRALSIANGDFFPDTNEWAGAVAKARAWENPPTLPQRAFPYERLRLAHTLMFTLPGIPMIYQGDEFGFAGAADPDNRRMMTFNLMNREQEITREHVINLIKLRQNHPALKYGTIQERWISDDVLVYSMEYQNDKVLIVLNRQNTWFNAPVYLGGMGWNDGKIFDAMSNRSLGIHNSWSQITVAPNSSAVFIR